jgi:Zn-dependent peptidase ImmA (M78 family)
LNQKQMLISFLTKQKKPQTLDEIMKFVEIEAGVPRSTIRARLSELRKKPVKVDDKLFIAEKNGEGWVGKLAEL